MLSPSEAAASARGHLLKRYVRAAAAMQGIYDDVALAEEVGIGRGSVAGWWKGAKPSPETVRSIAEATGLPTEELVAFIYYDGPPPRLPDVEGEARERADAAERSLHARPGDEGYEEPPAPRESAGSGRS